MEHLNLNVGCDWAGSISDLTTVIKKWLPYSASLIQMCGSGDMCGGSCGVGNGACLARNVTALVILAEMWAVGVALL